MNPAIIIPARAENEAMASGAFGIQFMEVRDGFDLEISPFRGSVADALAMGERIIDGLDLSVASVNVAALSASYHFSAGESA